MSAPRFFLAAGPLTLADIVEVSGATVAQGSDLSLLIAGAAPIEEAGPGQLACFDHPRTSGLAEMTRATACFVTAHDAGRLPACTLALIAEEPARAFGLALARFFPGAMRPGSMFASVGVNPGASIHPEARLEPGVIVDPGAVIGPRAEIGSGSTISANSVIGPDVRIGRDCAIGAQVTIVHALIGDRVILHPGARIGQSSWDPSSHDLQANARGELRPPRIGRVIIQDDVEVGANAAIDRGALGDTVIGEGATIGNLAQIGHSATVGRKSVIRARVSVSSGAQLGDFITVDG